MSKFDTHGGYFAPKDYLKVNEGGSHEENPNGGVQIGVDPEGIPNLLEEGEPVYKDYVYSDNIEAEKEFLEQNNLPGKYAGKLYSKIADDLFSEAEERPLDPISRNGLEALLERLADAQEGQKQAKEQRDLEDELAQLSPEELDQLEAMLTQGEQEQMAQEQMPMEVASEQMMGPAEPVSIEGMPMMANGGTLLRKYGVGGPKKTMADKIASEILAQANANGRASGIGNTDLPLVTEHPDIDLALAIAQPGSLLTKALAPAAYRGMINGLGNGEPAYMALAPMAEAEGVALSSKQISERLAKAKEAGEHIKKAAEDVRIATDKTKPLLKSLEKADRTKAELMRYSGTKTKALERAQSRLDDVDDAIENLVSSQEEALRSGESIPGFDVKLSQYGDVRASRVKSLEKARNDIDELNSTINVQTDLVGDLASEYDDAVKAANIPNEFRATTPSEAKRRNVLQTMFNPFYRGVRSYDIHGYDIHDGVGRGFKAMLGQAPIVFGSYAVPAAALGLGIEKSLSNRSGSATDSQEEFDPSLLEIGEWSSTPFTETDPLMEQHTTYENGVPVQTDTTYLSREFGGKINRFDEGGDAYRRFMNLVTNYLPSRTRGGIEGKYHIDDNFGQYLLGNKDIAALEHDPRFTRFTDLVVEKARQGNKRALMYLNKLDEGVADWTERLFDKNGKLRDDFERVYRDRRRDGLEGIYHLIPDLDNLDGFFDEPQAIQPVGVDGPGANPYDWHRSRAYNILNAVNPQTMIMARALEQKNVPGQLAERTAVDVSPVSSSGSGTGTGSVQQPAGPLPVWPRYAGAVGSGLLGLYNAFQSPDRYTATRINPQVPEGRINLQNQVYNPVDQNMIANAQIAQGNATNRALRNSGLGASSAAAILASDNNTTGNLGTGFIQAWDANNQRRNAVIAANNQAETQRANFDYTVDAARKEAINRFAPYNAQNDLTVQRLNNLAEADKYTAISNQISNGLQALSGIGRENFAMNQVNSNPAFIGYGTSPNGWMQYNPYYQFWLENKDKIKNG